MPAGHRAGTQAGLCHQSAKNATRPVAQSRRKNASYAVQIVTPETHEKKTFSYVWCPNQNLGSAPGQRLSYFRSSPWSLRVKRTKCQPPQKSQSSAWFRAQSASTQPRSKSAHAESAGVAYVQLAQHVAK